MNEVTICTLCTLRALLKGQAPEPFAEGPMEHARRAHPDPVAAQAEQEQLVKQLEERRACAAKAKFN